MFEPYAARSHEKMTEVLLDDKAIGPAIHYYMIRGGFDKKNITVWESGTIGNNENNIISGKEFIKAYGHYHITDFKETYWVIEGEGILILQQREKDSNGNYINDEVCGYTAIKVKKGDTVTIPPFAGHLMINTGKTWLVTSDDSPVAIKGDSVSMPKHADYEAVKKMKGFGYYVVANDVGGFEFVKNSKYIKLPDVLVTDAIGFAESQASICAEK